MFLNTTSLLSKIMGDDWPNQPEFMKVVGSRIQKAYQTVRLRVYGQMVAVLWAGDKDPDAIRLEGPWNTLQTVPPFSLLHAHPHSAFTSKEDPQSLFAVRHDTHVQCQKTGTSPATQSLSNRCSGFPSFLAVPRNPPPIAMLCFFLRSSSSTSRCRSIAASR